MTIVLSPDEIELAAIHAVTRRVAVFRRVAERGESARESRFHRNVNVDGNPLWEHDIQGACAELAYCKSRGVYWSGITGPRAKDGNRVEVRWTKHANGGLIAYQSDPDEEIIVLMDGKAPEFCIVGWMKGAEAKRPDFLTEHGYYLVPRSRIHLMNADGQQKWEQARTA